jgi:trehalose utilization protein
VASYWFGSKPTHCAGRGGISFSTVPGCPEGLKDYIELEEEMYGETFDVPPPGEQVFVSWFGGGEVFRSGLCYRRGRGRIFYFRTRRRG